VALTLASRVTVSTHVISVVENFLVCYVHNSHFKILSSFADKDEDINREWPSSDWDLNFSEQNGTTTVSIIKYSPCRHREDD
jgi:hypothetical protein